MLSDPLPGRSYGLVKRASLALLLSASLLVPSGASAQTDEEKAAARALATQGAAALNDNKYADALDLVTRAEAIVHAPTHVLMIARAQVGLGKLVAAQESFLKLIRETLAPNAPAAFKNAQAAAKDELAAIEPKIASLRIQVDGLGQRKATVKMDDQPVPPALLGVHRPVDPGRHEIAVYPVGGSPVKNTIELQNGEKKEIRLVVPDGPPPSGVPINAADNPDAGKTPVGPVKDTGGGGWMTGMRGAGIGVGAIGIAGVVVGAIFVAKGGSQASQADTMFANCMKPCPKVKQNEITALDKKAATSRTIGVIGLAAGAVALAGGVTLIVLGKPKPAPAKASIEPWFDGTSGGLRGAF